MKMKRIKFGYLNGINKEVIREVEVTEEDLNLYLKSQGYKKANHNLYEAVENLSIKFIEIM